jgi:hypothetical protein
MANFDLNNYETVEARLKRFWSDHPNGSIVTEVCSVTPDHKSIIIRALITFDKADTMPTGVGIAQESQGGNGPNSTSWTENCDTSAVGRALANCGYSGDHRPSREEMAKVGRGPQSSPPARFTDNRPGYNPAQNRPAPRPTAANTAAMERDPFGEN